MLYFTSQIKVDRTGQTSEAPMFPGYGVGYADSADPGKPSGLASGTIEIKYTLLGDATLQGLVNATDFADLATNINKWASGAAIGLPAIDDPAVLPFAAANRLLADVPDPASIGVTVFTGLGLLARGRSGRICKSAAGA